MRAAVQCLAQFACAMGSIGQPREITMRDAPARDWDPTASDVQADPHAAHDTMRERCPVAYSDYAGWTLFRHADVERVLHDPERFSNAVSTHVSVPNGMDPPQHTAFRKLIEPYFAAHRVAAFEPECRRIAAALVRTLDRGAAVELMCELAEPFAVRVQCAFLGWPESMHEPLREWTRKNHAATLARDRAAMSAVAREFADHVDQMVRARRDAVDVPAPDITSALLHETVNGRALHFDEIVSILRNWTMGEVGTIAAAVGILGYHLAAEPALQRRLRAQPDALPEAIEEILRLDGPLLSNRRVTTRAVAIGGRRLEVGARIEINWIAANRDPAVFEAPAQCRIERDQAHNLLYGAGIHLCPGAALSRMELRVVLTALLAGTGWIGLDAPRASTRARLPAAGFSELHLAIE
jgi:cytochrome P450